MTMLPTVYALLRDGLDWEARLTHLEVQPDGALALRRLPGLVGSAIVDRPGPFVVWPAGLALDSCRDVYLSDPTVGQVIRLDGVCNSQMVLPAIPDAPILAPGQFNHPRGLLLTDSDLLAADSNNGRIQVLRLPTLEVHAIWSAGLDRPAALAAAPGGGVYILDAGLERVLRFTANGTPDSAYLSPVVINGYAIASAEDGQLFVSLPDAGEVAVFAPDGTPAGALAPGGPAQPGALACAKELLYAADSAEGRIWVYDLALGAWIGALAGYRGTVAALAAAEDGRLAALTGNGREVLWLEAGAAGAAAGWLEAGPLDAGDVSTWVRVHLKVEDPGDGAARLSYFSAPAKLPGPTAADWIPAPAVDFLLQSPDAMLDHPALRYLWLRVELRPTLQGEPRLWQVEAQTASEDWMNFLPAVYRRTDHDQGDFLRRWLALLQSELGDLETGLGMLARRFDPASAELADLPWLAGWLGCTLPPGLPAEEQRELLARLLAVYHRRGTRLGVAEWVEIYTGVRPLILEDYRERHLWILGQVSSLGFDTGLAPALPQGMVVPDSERDPTCVRPAGTSGPEEVSTQVEAAPWSEPAGLVVGSVVVGQSGPLPADRWGEPLFSESAHRFTVLVPGMYMPSVEARRWLAQVIEAEKPAHTDYRLCFIEAEMRVGFQARIGIDTILAGPPEPASLGEAALSKNAHLGGEATAPGWEQPPARAGATRIGRDFILG